MRTATTPTTLNLIFSFNKSPARLATEIAIAIVNIPIKIANLSLNCLKALFPAIVANSK